MTIHAWPALGHPAAAEWDLVTQTQEHVSPLDNATQTRELIGARWSLELRLPPLQQAAARAWIAFKAKIAGAAGRFYMGPPYPFYTARGTPTGTPLVNGAGQAGRELITDGWTPSTTVLLAGDFVSFDNYAGGRQLVVMTEDIASDGSGNATLIFGPPLRRAPLDNAGITVASPTCIMKLLNDEQGRVSFDEAQNFGLTLSLIEVFPP